MPPAPPPPPPPIAPAPHRTLGAWLVTGPYDRSRLPEDAAPSPTLDDAVVEGGASSRWRLVSSPRGAIDLVAAFGPQGRDRAVYAGGVLHVERGGYYTLLLGADDGLAAFVDGKRVLSHDEPRARRDDEDLLGVDLTAGDHTLVLALLHRSAGPWAFRARILDAGLDPPLGSRGALPGTTVADAQARAAHRSRVSFARGRGDKGYRGTLSVHFPAGAPLDVPVDVSARLVPRASASAGRPAVFDIDAGQLAVGERSATPLTVILPWVAAEEIEDDDWTLHVDVGGRTLDLPV